MRARKRKELGQYIVTDSEICGGQLTFKGTRIFVKDVLAMLAKGYDWKRISSEFDGRLSHEAIAEAKYLGFRPEPGRRADGSFFSRPALPR